MPRPMDLGRAVLFAGSGLLLISLFLEWYDVGLTGWEVFETLDLVLAALALGGMAASVRPDLLPSWSGLALPGAALLIVVVQLLNDPPAAAGASPSSGAWIALAGTFLMAAGSALSLSAISVTVQVRERDVRRRIPAVDRRNDEPGDDAEDLDAAPRGDEPHGEAPRSDAPSGSLFATGMGGTGTRADADRGTAAGDEPPRRSGRFTPRPADAASPADDLERTQPLADDADAPERP